MADNDITVNEIDGLAIPDRVAVISVVPAATGVTQPEESMVATPVLLLAHVT